MDFSRLKKIVASASVAAISLTQVGVAFAAYSDVPSGVWYGDAVTAFTAAGYLDSTQARFRGSDPANRAEFVKLVVELNGGILSTPPAVPSFDDTAVGTWYYGYFEEAGKEGWVRGDGDCYGSHPCYARPSANINRAEAAALIVRSFALDSTSDAPQFVDNPSGQWYTSVIQTAADHCVLQGDDATGRVRPGDNMNRAEMVVMLHRVDQGLAYGVDCGTDVVVLPKIKDVIATSTTTVEVEFTLPVDQTVAEDIDTYTVTNGSEIDVTSASMIGDDVVELTFSTYMVANHRYTLTVSDMETADGETFSDAMDFNGYSAIAIGDGILEVSLASSNPVGDTVPKGAVGVVMLSVDLTASCDDSVIVEHMTVLHEGFGDSSDIDGLYAAIDGARVTRKRVIDSSDQTSNLRFSSPLVIDPCETVTLDLVGDYTTTADTGAEHNLVVELASDLVSNARSTTGNLPLRGNTFTVAAVSGGTTTVSYRTVSPSKVEVGDTGVVVGKFEVSVNSVEDQTFYSMTLEQNSSASDGDFTNIAIRRTDGTVLTNTVSSTVGDFVTLVFDPPFTVLQGDRITLEVIADIVGGAGNTLQMQFEETSDVFAVGSLYGYGSNGQLYGSQVTISTTTASTITIDAGAFTIGVSGPSTQTYTRDDNDAVFANILFRTGEEKVDVKSIYMVVEGESSSGKSLDYYGGTTSDTIAEVLQGVEIRNKATGRTVSAVRLTGAGDAGSVTDEGTFQVYRFDDFIVNGDEEWEFRADFIDNGTGEHPMSGDKFRVHICGEPTKILDSSNNLTTNSVGCTVGTFVTNSTALQMQVNGLSTGDSVGDVRPRGLISGNFHEIAAASLQIAVRAQSSTETAVENSQDISLLRFEARAGDAEDILLTKLIFAEGAGDAQNISDYTLWVDTDGDGIVDTVMQDGVAVQASQVSFNSLAGGGFVIPAEETVIFEVRGDVASSLKTANTLRLAFASGSTFVEAEELDDGSSLSGISFNSAPILNATSTDIAVTSVASPLYTFVSQGDLYVTQDSTPVSTRQLLGGALSEPVLRLQMRAENEPIDVTNIILHSSGSTAGSVERLELYADNAATPFASATVGACAAADKLTHNPNSGNNNVAAFCASMGSQQLVVPEGEDLDIIIRARLKTDAAGATSNQELGFFLYSSVGSTSATGAVRGRGYHSSNDLVINDGDLTAGGEVFIGVSSPAVSTTIASDEHVSVLSKIASITNANADANGTTVPTGVYPIGQFKFAAAQNSNSRDGVNKVTLSGVVFSVNATNITIDSSTFKFYNKAAPSTTTTCTAYKASDYSSVSGVATGSLLVNCNDLAESTVSTEISAGADSTFVLQANVTNASVSASATSTLQVSMQNFDTKGKTSGYGVGASSTYSYIYWTDKDSLSNVPFTWVEYPETVVNSTSYRS